MTRVHPMIFSAPMVRALLDGRKTQTRRLAWRPCPRCDGEGYDRKTGRPLPEDGCRVCTTLAPPGPGGVVPTVWQRTQPGDLIWVKEAHGWMYPQYANDSHEPTFYRADHANDIARGEILPRWRSPIHMPRWASRLTLEARDVRVQRVREISEEDALSEGFTFPDGMEWGGDPIDAFRNYWDSLHKPGELWTNDPWVCAISFAVHRANVDEKVA